MLEMSRWDRFVDAVTVVWLGVFILGFVSVEYGDACDLINLLLLPVFIVDLFVIYRRVGDVKVLLRKHWLDILMVIPYLRVIRAVRIIRVVRLARVAKTTRAVKAVEATKTAKASKIAEDQAIAKTQKLIKAYRKFRRVVRNFFKLYSMTAECFT